MSSAPGLQQTGASAAGAPNHPLKAAPAGETDIALSMDQDQPQKAAAEAGAHSECLPEHSLTGPHEGPCAPAAGGQATPAAAPEAAQVAAEAAPSVDALAAAAAPAVRPDPSTVDAITPAPAAAPVTADVDAAAADAAGGAAAAAGDAAEADAAAGGAVAAAAAGEAPPAAPAGAEAASAPAAAVDPASYGAAAASLQDPACQPGTPQFEAAKVDNEQLLQQYNSLERQIHSKKGFKPDMQACSQLKLRRDLAGRFRAGVFGHIPGVALGAQFLGRGQLAVLGLHGQMMKGIDCKSDYAGGAAVAICMAGGYKDDDDTGATITYTGAGGQKGKRQVKDQSYDYQDNAALVKSHESSTPVRVFRGQKAKVKGEYPVYSYEGLFTITGHRMEPSADGPLVIRYTLQGVPGHYVVSTKVEYKSLHRSQAFTRIQLTGEGGRRPAKRRKKSKGESSKWTFVLPGPEQIASRIRARQEAGSHGRLVSADLSGGAEPVPIPVWNDADDDDTFHVCSSGLEDLPDTQQQQQQAAAAEHGAHSSSSVGDQSSAGGSQSSGGQSRGGGSQSSGDQSSGSGGSSGFKYIKDYSFGGKAVEELVALAGQRFAEACTTTCGIQYHGGDCPYNVEDCLMATHPYGVMECGPDCEGAGRAASKLRRHLCKRNRVVSEGIKYPLEIFKVPGKGWGVRCAVDVPAGAVLCNYIGKLTTDEAAEQLRGADMYLYDLSHFTTLAEENAKQPDPDANPLLPPLPAELPQHLVVDAGQEGNVARFINHACAPNCVVQPVLTKNARSHLLYYNAIVAQEDIPAFTELTYNYNYQHHHQQPDAADEAAAAAGGGADGASSSHAAQEGGRRVPCVCGAANCCKWLLIS